ncbi:6-bladed beta-propeller [Algoriphagus antarcticus]|uniref:6-bladed beta-propeller protein n=1 Tax=Algoriphagus antarcticus TaxID=238540 RepID=A0A3E0DLF9_9BACT|nr:6-bladed beta-propeller [Algoriphagus antarcticus]REG83502.1 6-bladed beta-propeller protein [Algoriphagus antarcticus]
MKPSKKTLFFLFIPILFSCVEKKSQTTDQLLQKISVQVESKKAYSFQEIFEVVDVIPIKNSQNFPIARIKNIKIIEDKFWILTSKLVLIADLEGNLEKVIQSQGYGPLEYQKLSDIHWNPYLSLVEILDSDQGKIIRYDKNGVPKNEWKNKFLRLASSFYPQENNYWIYGGTFFDGEGARLVVVDNQNDKKLNTFFPLGDERNYLNVIEPNNFIAYNQDMLFFHSYNDTIYSIENDNLNPTYLLDFGPNKIPSELFSKDFKDIMEFGQELEKNGYIDLLGSIYFSEDKIFFRFFYEGKPISAVYSIKDKSTKIITNWKDEFGAGFGKLSSFLINMPIDSDGEFLYVSVDPYGIKSEAEKLKDNPSYDQFMLENLLIKNIIDQFDTYENPYILKLKVR